MPSIWRAMASTISISHRMAYLRRQRIRQLVCSSKSFTVIFAFYQSEKSKHTSIRHIHIRSHLFIEKENPFSSTTHICDGFLRLRALISTQWWDGAMALVTVLPQKSDREIIMSDDEFDERNRNANMAIMLLIYTFVHILRAQTNEKWEKLCMFKWEFEGPHQTITFGKFNAT